MENELNRLIEQRIRESIETKKSFLSQAENIALAAEKMIYCLRRDGKVLVFGNGGSAADSQHIAGELVGRYKMERKGLPVIALTTDTSILTAWANDYNFESVFERQVEALARKGDVLFGISTSGNSMDVVKAMEYGGKIGAMNISLTGNDGGKIKNLSEVNINCYSKDTPRIQECHMLAYHTICEIVEREMASNPGGFR